MANSKDVLVAGVSTGIGWGTTKVLVSKGFRVFGSVRKQADADRLQREFGNGFVPLLMDITDADAVDSFRIYRLGVFGASAEFTYCVSVGPKPEISTKTGSAPVRA